VSQQTMAFRKATKRNARLRLALIGPPGSGKTWTGLTLACALGSRVAVIDTERGSASKYADRFNFDVMDLSDSFHPRRYVDALAAAAQAGYEVVLVDSLSHAWIGKEGGLDLHDKAVDRQKTKNSFTAWSEVTPHHMALVDALIQSPLHVIATMRSKVEYVQEKDANGRSQVRKVGTAPLMRDGVEYEFDVVGDLDQDHTLVITKTRCPALSGPQGVIREPGKPLALTLAAWLQGQPQETTPQKPAAANGHAETPPLKPGEEFRNKVAQAEEVWVKKGFKRVGQLLKEISDWGEQQKPPFPQLLQNWNADQVRAGTAWMQAEKARVEALAAQPA